MYRFSPVYLLIAGLFVGMFSFTDTVNASIAEDVKTYCSDVTFDDYVPSDECYELMRAIIDPAVTDIPQDRFTLSYYNYWHVVSEGDAPVFDAPDGNVVRTISNGFNFVIAVDSQSVPGWVEIQGGGWMRDTDINYYRPSYYSGAQVMNRLEQEFGWIMFNLFPAQFPGGKQAYEDNPLYLKYDRFNVFAEAADEEGIVWYMIGPDMWVEQRWVAIAKTTERPEGVKGRWLAIDLYEQTMVGYEEDTPIFATIVSTGLPGSDTRLGTFKVWARAAADPMSGGMGPTTYALQNVPWVIYFDGDIALHGTYWHDGFGYRRSRGCVNLSVSDARFVYEWTGENPEDEDGMPETYVYVYSSGEYGQFGITQG